VAGGWWLVNGAKVHEFLLEWIAIRAFPNKNVMHSIN
jgi:hypothetical protein